MKIAIDISQVVYGTGVSVYTENLVKNLLTLDSKDLFLLYAGVLRKQTVLSKFTSSLKGNFVNLNFPIPPSLADVLWNRIHLFPIDMFSGKVDVFHSSDWTQPKSYAYKVTTIHDLVPLKYPEFSSKKIVDVHKRRLEHVFKEVDKIIVPSFTTKTDVVNLGGCEERVIVIPEAVDPMLKKQSFKKSKEVLNKFNLEKRYLLSIGITPRKNTKRIIESLKIIRKEMDFELVLIGQDFVGLKREDNVRILGHVEKDEIAALYQNAQALIYPSLYEGFGLPILEGYFMGVPVVTSNFGSMKEIGEGVSILVDPYDVESISAGIVEAVENRARMIQKGKNVLKKYSWEETARQTLEVYKRKI